MRGWANPGSWGLLGALAALLAGCPKPSPSASPVPPGVIWVELVEGGCLDPADDGGLAAIELGLAAVDGQPPWMSCLREGGTVQGCSVPCSNPGSP